MNKNTKTMETQESLTAQERVLLDYLEEALIEAEATTQHLIDTGTYLSCKAETSKVKVAIDAAIRNLKNKQDGSN
jgi:hypothetical protein